MMQLTVVLVHCISLGMVLSSALLMIDFVSAANVTWTLISANAAWPGIQGLSGVTFSSDIVLTGGWSPSTGYVNEVWRSTDGALSWVSATNNPGYSPRSSVGLVLQESTGALYLSGGLSGSGANQNDVWRSTDKGSVWTRQTAAAAWPGRFAHCHLIMSSGTHVVLGGLVDLSFTSFNDVWLSNDSGVGWSQVVAPAPWSKRSGLGGSLCVRTHSDTIIVVGGCFTAGASDQCSNDVWTSNDTGSAWRQETASAPWAVRYAGGLATDSLNNLFLFGGTSNGATLVYNDLWISRDLGASWSQLMPSAPFPRKYNFAVGGNFGMIVDSTNLLIIGGVRQGGTIFLNEVYAANLSSANVPSFIAQVTGDPHFVGLDGSEFDFMGNEDGAVYALYSSVKLHVNGRFKLGNKQKYPQYDKPMFMDVITVTSGNHRLEYNIYEAPLYNGVSFTLQNNFDRRVIFSTDKFSLIAEFVTVMFEISGLFRLNVTMFRDNWSTPYMDVRLMFSGIDADHPVKGIIGSTLPRLAYPDGTFHVDRAAISIASGSAIAHMTADRSNEATTTTMRPNVFWESYFNEHEADYRVKGDDIYGFDCVQCMYGTVM